MKLFTKQVVPIVLVLALAQTVRAATYLKHASCNVEYNGQYCGIRYLSASSDSVTSVPDDKCLACYDDYKETECYVNSAPYKAYLDGGSVEDTSDCRWTGCSFGGCASDEIETDATYCGLNRNEYCCKKLPTWRCCYVQDCTEPPTCPTTVTACSTVCAAQGHGSYNHGLLNGVCFCNLLQSNQQKPVCNSPKCDASSAPTNGGVGTCTSSLAAGATCQPTCNAGYTVSGTTTCSSSGTLTPATCALTPSTGWSIRTGDSLTLSTNTCSAGYTTCQALCAQGYSVSLVGTTYTLTPTASQASLPSGCSCYTLTGTPNANGVMTVSNTGFGTVTSTQTSATTYTVYIAAGPCTLTYTKNTGSSTSGDSSSGDCQCSCCSSNSCTASVIGYLNTGSSSSCTNAACRTQFPSQCPSSGSSGTVSSLYTNTSPNLPAGSSLGSTSGASRLTHAFTFAALIAGALTLF